jgi:hypothetical protein
MLFRAVSIVSFCLYNMWSHMQHQHGSRMLKQNSQHTNINSYHSGPALVIVSTNLMILRVFLWCLDSIFFPQMLHICSCAKNRVYRWHVLVPTEVHMFFSLSGSMHPFKCWTISVAEVTELRIFLTCKIWECCPLQFLLNTWVRWKSNFPLAIYLISVGLFM